MKSRAIYIYILQVYTEEVLQNESQVVITKMSLLILNYDLDNYNFLDRS